MKERDFSSLIDKEVIYTDGSNEYIGKIVNIDYDIGLTIVDKDNPNEYLVCLIGPSAHKNYDKKLDEKWPSIFYSTVRQIKNGKLTPNICEKILHSINQFSASDPGPEYCAFNQ